MFNKNASLPSLFVMSHDQIETFVKRCGTNIDMHGLEHKFQHHMWT